MCDCGVCQTCQLLSHIADEGLAKAASQLEPVAKSNLRMTVTEVSLNQGVRRKCRSQEVRSFVPGDSYSLSFQGARDLTTGGLIGEMYLWSAV